MNAPLQAQTKVTPPSPAAVSVVPTGLLQRKCACGGSPGVDGECAACRNKRLQRQPAGQADPASAPPIVHEVLRTPGQPLDSATRAFMEPRFGHDFGQARVHTDARSAESAQAVGALAYTVGHHVVFAQGQYAPATVTGRQLVAHELTHVVQQRNDPSPLDGDLMVNSPMDPAEQEADRVAVSAAGIGVSQISGRVSRRLQKQPAEQGGVPCALDAYRAHVRTVDLQPVSFRSSAADPSPTGGSLNRRLTSSNTIWNKVGVTFSALSTVTLTDATNKTAGSTDAEANRIGALQSGSGVEVYFVDNPMTSAGGASTLSAGTASNIVISDGGTSDTLLAHELGHVLGLDHPPAGGDANTIMEPSGSRDVTNPTRNTVGNYNRITWPAGNPTCIRPDA